MADHAPLRAGPSDEVPVFVFGKVSGEGYADDYHVVFAEGLSPAVALELSRSSGIWPIHVALERAYGQRLWSEGERVATTLRCARSAVLCLTSWAAFRDARGVSLVSEALVIDHELAKRVDWGALLTRRDRIDKSVWQSIAGDERRRQYLKRARIVRRIEGAQRSLRLDRAGWFALHHEQPTEAVSDVLRGLGRGGHDGWTALVDAQVDHKELAYQMQRLFQGFELPLDPVVVTLLRPATTPNLAYPWRVIGRHEATYVDAPARPSDPLPPIVEPPSDLPPEEAPEPPSRPTRLAEAPETRSDHTEVEACNSPSIEGPKPPSQGRPEPPFMDAPEPLPRESTRHPRDPATTRQAPTSIDTRTPIAPGPSDTAGAAPLDPTSAPEPPALVAASSTASRAIGAPETATPSSETTQRQSDAKALPPPSLRRRARRRASSGEDDGWSKAAVDGWGLGDVAEAKKNLRRQLARRRQRAQDEQDEQAPRIGRHRSWGAQTGPGAASAPPPQSPDELANAPTEVLEEDADDARVEGGLPPAGGADSPVDPAPPEPLSDEPDDPTATEVPGNAEAPTEVLPADPSANWDPAQTTEEVPPGSTRANDVTAAHARGDGTEEDDPGGAQPVDPDPPGLAKLRRRSARWASGATIVGAMLMLSVAAIFVLAIRQAPTAVITHPPQPDPPTAVPSELDVIPAPTPPELPSPFSEQLAWLTCLAAHLHEQDLLPDRYREACAHGYPSANDACNSDPPEFETGQAGRDLVSSLDDASATFRDNVLPALSCGVTQLTLPSDFDGTEEDPIPVQLSVPTQAGTQLTWRWVSARDARMLSNLAPNRRGYGDAEWKLIALLGQIAFSNASELSIADPLNGRYPVPTALPPAGEVRTPEAAPIEPTTPSHRPSPTPPDPIPRSVVLPVERRSAIELPSSALQPASDPIGAARIADTGSNECHISSRIHGSGFTRAELTRDEDDPCMYVVCIHTDRPAGLPPLPAGNTDTACTTFFYRPRQEPPQISLDHPSPFMTGRASFQCQIAHRDQPTLICNIVG